MEGGRKAENFKYCSGNAAFYSNTSITHRNLTKGSLAGVIFGCTNDTMRECLQTQLFGLPEAHFSYVKNVSAGLPLFLFNYSNRKLHGVYEAVSHGQKNINPYAWTDGSERTHFPAQVQVKVRHQYQPLMEDHFKRILKANYYSLYHFWFELDHTQVSKLISLMSSSAVAPSVSTIQRTACRYAMSREGETPPEQLPPSNIQINCSAWKSNSVQTLFPSSAQNQISENAFAKSELEKPAEKDLLLSEHKDSLSEGPADLPSDGQSQYPSIVHGTPDIDQGTVQTRITTQYEGNEESLRISCDSDITIEKLIHKVAELETQRNDQALKMSHLEEKMVLAETEIERLKNLLNFSSSPQRETVEILDERHIDLGKPIFLVGGYNGSVKLSSLDSYYLSCNVIKSLKPMSSVRTYASAAILNEEIYVFGGGDGRSTWYDSAESYSVAENTWKSQPSLNMKRGSLAGAVWDDKIFAIGGGNGLDCFAYVEMLDLDIGRWITTQSMVQKRFGLAAIESNGVIYACGGYDGSNYLNSAECLDPRESSWRRIPNMNSKRACHSLIVLNENLYALGGYDGSSMVSSVEIYDPRLSLWMPGEPMNCARGYSGSVVVDQSIYVIGGLEEDSSVSSTVECYKDGQGWQATATSVVGKRCFMSAVVI